MVQKQLYCLWWPPLNCIHIGHADTLRLTLVQMHCYWLLVYNQFYITRKQMFSRTVQVVCTCTSKDQYSESHRILLEVSVWLSSAYWRNLSCNQKAASQQQETTTCTRIHWSQWRGQTDKDTTNTKLTWGSLTLCLLISYCIQTLIRHYLERIQTLETDSKHTNSPMSWLIVL